MVLVLWREQGLVPATEASGALVLDEAFLDLATPGGQGQASTSTEQLMELSLPVLTARWIIS